MVEVEGVDREVRKGSREGVVRWKEWLLEVEVVGRCGGMVVGSGSSRECVVEVVLWRAGCALVNAVAALGEGTCSGVLSVGMCKSLILQGFNML